ncbi:amidase, partial [Klebsiella pneumoniae]|nr:amidase [Klebsiella pneumoniae]
GDLEPGSIVPHEYIELHIEQGPVLEAEGIQIGAVENLQGISWQEITIKGTANHAGTTPTRLPVLTIRQSRKCLKNGCVLSVILFAQCTKQNVNSFTHMSFHLQSIIRGKLHMQLTQRFAYSAKKMWIPR